MINFALSKNDNNNSNSKVGELWGLSILDSVL